jgi:hypothetical protein
VAGRRVDPGKHAVGAPFGIGLYIALEKAAGLFKG